MTWDTNDWTDRIFYWYLLVSEVKKYICVRHLQHVSDVNPKLIFWKALAQELMYSSTGIKNLISERMWQEKMAPKVVPFQRETFI